jgi:hypothetical protein
MTLILRLISAITDAAADAIFSRHDCRQLDTYFASFQAFSRHYAAAAATAIADAFSIRFSRLAIIFAAEPPPASRCTIIADISLIRFHAGLPR